MGWLARYRHSRGFGIHSPFAFRFITEVLGERCPYYAYEHLVSARQKLIYRIAARLSPASYGAVGGADDAAVGMACPQAVKRAGAVELLVAGCDAEIAQIEPTLAAGGVVVVDGRNRPLVGEARACLDALGHGMTFDNSKDLAIIVAYPHLPRQDFATRM